MLGKVIDVTFQGGREQSEILKEIDGEVTSVSEKNVDSEVEDSLVPEVVTNGTLKDFCLEVIKNTPKNNQKKRRVYAGIMKLIDENEELKGENRKYKMQELQKQEKSADIVQEIEDEDNKE